MVLPVWPIWRSEVTQPFWISGREAPNSAPSTEARFFTSWKFSGLCRPMPPATTTPGAAQTQPGGGTCFLIVPPAGYPAPCYNAYIVKSDASGNTVFATYLGGASNSDGEVIAVDASGSIYVAGATGGSFPTTPNAAVPTSGAPLTNGYANATFAAKNAANASGVIGTGGFESCVSPVPR